MFPTSPASQGDLSRSGLPSFHQSQDSLHYKGSNPPPPPRTATLPPNFHKPTAPAPPPPTNRPRPPVARPPPPPTRPVPPHVPPPPPPTAAPPPPPHRTAPVKAFPPPPPVSIAERTCGPFNCKYIRRILFMMFKCVCIACLESPCGPTSTTY